jgi:hypothetical protein
MTQLEESMGSFQVGIPELVVVAFMALMALVVIWPTARICERAGFSPWLGILTVIPIANIVLLWFIAMAPWPARRE